MRHAGAIHLSWPTLRGILRLPDDCVCDGLAYDPETNMVNILVEGHATLPLVPDGAVMPWVDVEYELLANQPTFARFVPYGAEREPEPLHVDTLETV